MFDDGNVTDYSIAKPILDEYHLVGVSAIITSYINKPNFLSLDEIKALAADNWEIVSHTVDHPDLTTLTPAQYDAELKNSLITLKGDGFTVNSIAFPFGAYNSDILADAETYYSSARDFEDGYNPQGSFPFEIKIQKIVATTTVADVQGWIQHAKDNDEWLIIVTHLINSNGDNIYHVSPQVFEASIQAVADSGVPVITYQQGIEEYAVSDPFPASQAAQQSAPIAAQNNSNSASGTLIIKIIFGLLMVGLISYVYLKL
jgi:hypothetical protein